MKVSYTITQEEAIAFAKRCLEEDYGQQAKEGFDVILEVIQPDNVNLRVNKSVARINKIELIKLMKIKELLAKPENWTKGNFAKDKLGFVVPVNSKEAVCWCLAGAINKCYLNNDFNILTLLNNNDIYHIPSWNDAPERTHAEVLALVERLDI